MTCMDCGETGLPTGVGAFKIRQGVLRCTDCDHRSLFSGCFEKRRGGITTKDLDEAERIEEVLGPLVAVAQKKVRVPQVCSTCAFVEGPTATRADQVFERYGRLLCRLCRKKGRDGTSRRRRRPKK